jgi:hypothetical protein
LQTTLTVDAHPAEKQFLHEEQTLSKQSFGYTEQELEEQQFSKPKGRICNQS